jgi:single-stranded DNA-binding protein
MNVNNCTIVGRLAGNPSMKSFKKGNGEDGYRLFMRIAVTRLGDLGAKREEQRTNFVPVVVWGKLAQTCATYLAKGTEVTCLGEFIAESKPKLDAAGAHIAIDGKNQYDEYLHLQANSVQFGRKSNKNATPADMQAQLAAIQTRIDGMASEGTAPAAGSASTPAPATPAPAEGTNPFEGEASA